MYCSDGSYVYSFYSLSPFSVALTHTAGGWEVQEHIYAGWDVFVCGVSACCLTAGESTQCEPSTWANHPFHQESTLATVTDHSLHDSANWFVKVRLRQCNHLWKVPLFNTAPMTINFQLVLWKGLWTVSPVEKSGSVCGWNEDVI